MAIGLEQLQSKKKAQSQQVEEQKDKVQRPWEVNNSTSQSFSGNSAVKKARETVARNNYEINKLRADQAGENSVNETELYIQKKDDQFLNLTQDFSRVQRIKSSAGIFSRMKRSLLGR